MKIVKRKTCLDTQLLRRVAFQLDSRGYHLYEPTALFYAITDRGDIFGSTQQINLWPFTGYLFLLHRQGNQQVLDHGVNGLNNQRTMVHGSFVYSGDQRVELTVPETWPAILTVGAEWGDQLQYPRAQNAVDTDLGTTGWTILSAINDRGQIAILNIAVYQIEDWGVGDYLSRFYIATPVEDCRSGPIVMRAARKPHTAQPRRPPR